MNWDFTKEFMYWKNDLQKAKGYKDVKEEHIDIVLRHLEKRLDKRCCDRLVDRLVKIYYNDAGDIVVAYKGHYIETFLGSENSSENYRQGDIFTGEEIVKIQ